MALLISFSFSFVFSFSFWKTHWPSFLGNSNLLWAVNKAKVGFAKYYTVLQFFNLQERQNHKYRVKMRCKSRKIDLYYIYIKVNLQNFRLLQTEVNCKPLYKHKKGFVGHEVQVKPKPKV